MPKYRHEYKYFISDAELEIIKSRLENILPLDSHVAKEGKYQGIYNIRSVYFDDYRNRCFYENVNGTDPREKFRIRIYNHSDERINLELKRKVQGKCLKMSETLTREQVNHILSGEIPRISNETPALVNKLALDMNMKRLQPKVIVEYERTPYVYQLGNVRVTLDQNIVSSNQVQDFFDVNLPVMPVLPMNMHLLEVKWDEFIPDFIMDALDLGNLQRTSFSKYYICCCKSLGRTVKLYKG